MWIIIQARSNSSRFPNKVMADLYGFPVIKNVFDICARVTNKIIVAIPINDPIKEYLTKQHILYYEGSEKDVLARYYHCARSLDAERIVRITADCPLLPVSLLDYMSRLATREKLDFLTNAPCPDGYDIEIMSSAALNWAHITAKTDYHREHVTTLLKENWIKMGQMGFKIAKITEPYLLDWFPKLSIDTPEDLNRIKNIYKNLNERVKQ